ncbi:MAG: C39 family peptidase [Patescibacteria group bacterium]
MMVLIIICLLVLLCIPFFGLAQIKRVEKKIYYKIAQILPIEPAVKLSVPFHKQEHALSCEVASLRMVLNYKQIQITEKELIKQLPVSDPKPRSKNNVWGDPDLGFVGNIDGKMPNTGYGVYERPIYDLASKYRLSKILTKGSLNDLTLELANDNPVIVWGVVGKGKDISWRTKEGKAVKARLIEHARVLIGFTGTQDKPDKMILLDPVYGEIRMKVKDFLYNWELMDKRAVVIY